MRLAHRWMRLTATLRRWIGAGSPRGFPTSFGAWFGCLPGLGSCRLVRDRRTGGSMRRIALAAALSLLVLATVPLAQVSQEQSKNYIVVLKGSVSRPGAVASEHAAKLGMTVRYVYTPALEGSA